MKRKKRRQRKEEEDQGNSTSNEQTDTLPRLRPGAATASSRRQPPPESPVKMRSARKQSSVTAYDLKEYLAKSKIVGDRYNISNVIETANRLKNGDTAVDQKSNDSGYSDTAPRMKPSPFGNKFRDIVMKAAADKRAASEITVKQRAGSQFQRYEEVFQAVNLSNEEFEAKIKGMKHLPPVQNKGDLHKKEKKKIPPTPRIEMNIKLALPPIVMSQQAAALGKRRSSITNQFSAGYDKDADYEFYKDIKFTYVLLPVPDQEFPRKCIKLWLVKRCHSCHQAVNKHRFTDIEQYMWCYLVHGAVLIAACWRLQSHFNGIKTINILKLSIAKHFCLLNSSPEITMIHTSYQ